MTRFDQNPQAGNRRPPRHRSCCVCCFGGVGQHEQHALRRCNPPIRCGIVAQPKRPPVGCRLQEQVVPFIVNRVLDLPHAPELRNFDAFHVACAAAAQVDAPAGAR